VRNEISIWKTTIINNKRCHGLTFLLPGLIHTNHKKPATQPVPVTPPQFWPVPGTSDVVETATSKTETWLKFRDETETKTLS